MHRDSLIHTLADLEQLAAGDDADLRLRLEGLIRLRRMELEALRHSDPQTPDDLPVLPPVLEG